MLKTAICKRGFKKAHKKPKKADLYLVFNSLVVKANNRSRHPYSFLKKEKIIFEKTKQTSSSLMLFIQFIVTHEPLLVQKTVF